jgi:hypothetical protein
VTSGRNRILQSNQKAQNRRIGATRVVGYSLRLRSHRFYGPADLVFAAAAISAGRKINLFFTMLFRIFQVGSGIIQGFCKISAWGILADAAKTCRDRINL